MSVRHSASSAPLATPLARFVALYALMYAAFGVSSPFMPAFFASRGVTSGQLGLLLAADTAVRLVSGPLAGRLADLTGAVRAVLAFCTALATLVALCLLPLTTFAALLLISVCHAAALAPITTLADALALGAAERSKAERRFEYGWVRGTGSALFIAGTLVSGQVVSAFGLASILALHAALLAAAAWAALLVPKLAPRGDVTVTGEHPRHAGFSALLRTRPFRFLMVVSALVLGSHAMHDAFAVIRWRSAGISPAVVSLLWSESVAAEVLVFFMLGPSLVDRLRPAGAAALAAAAGVVRWIAMALTTNVAVLAFVQPLHGLTFAVLHLACMRLMATIVPQPLAATAQAMYALGAGATTALLTLASGALYARLGARGFLVMALLSAGAVPLSAGLRSDHLSLGRSASTIR